METSKPFTLEELVSEIAATRRDKKSSMKFQSDCPMVAHLIRYAINEADDAVRESVTTHLASGCPACNKRVFNFAKKHKLDQADDNEESVNKTLALSSGTQDTIDPRLYSGTEETIDPRSNVLASTSMNPEELLVLEEDLENLAKKYPIVAKLVRLRVFEKMTILEAAKILGLSDNAANDDWQFARAWLAKAKNDRCISHS